MSLLPQLKADAAEVEELIYRLEVPLNIHDTTHVKYTCTGSAPCGCTAVRRELRRALTF